MARYFRATGPPANFELTAAPQAIPGLSITEYFGTGPLLLQSSLYILSAVAGNVSFSSDILIDGVIVSQSQGFNVPDLIGLTLHTRRLINVDQDTHTIIVQATGAAAVGDFLPLNASDLTVIELPLWHTQGIP